MAVRLAIACVAVTALVPTGAMAAVGGPAAEGALVDAVNQVRHRHGLRPLRLSAPLAHSAGRLAGVLMEKDLLAHVGGVDLPGRFRARGEALAMHPGWRPRARRTVRVWMRSAAHRAVLLGRFRHAGAGMKRGRFGRSLATVWVLHVGRR
jgi:uncharacterized protein YkwD